MAYQKCGFFHASSNGLIVRAFIVTLGTIEWRINSVDFFMSFQMANGEHL
jgi:hypothetical protein